MNYRPVVILWRDTGSICFSNFWIALLYGDTMNEKEILPLWVWRDVMLYGCAYYTRHYKTDDPNEVPTIERVGGGIIEI